MYRQMVGLRIGRIIMTSKFNFYDIVKVNTTKKHLKEINGCEGVIRGMAQNEETGLWGYGVSIYNDNGIVWHVMEDDLRATGKKANPEDFKIGESIKVEVNPKTGEGKISEDE